MSRTLFRYVALTFFSTLVSVTLGAVVMFLVADFSDRASLFLNFAARDVAAMYADKALLCVVQVLPITLLLATTLTVTSLQRRGELTALLTLGRGPVSLYAPIGACVLVACAGAVAWDEYVAGPAGLRVDIRSTTTFRSGWGDWYTYYRAKEWFHRGDYFLRLEGGDARNGFSGVLVLQMNPTFGVARRIDAELLIPAGGTRWAAKRATVRTFEGGTRVERADSLELDVGLSADDLDIRPGRPEHLSFESLDQQIASRARVALPTRAHRLAWHQRIAWPLIAASAALLILGVSLRRGRRASMTIALGETGAAALMVWAAMLTARTLVFAGHTAPALAVWGVAGFFAATAAAVCVYRVGRLGSLG